MSLFVCRTQETSTVSKPWIVLWICCLQNQIKPINSIHLNSRLYIIRKKTKSVHRDDPEKHGILPSGMLLPRCWKARALWELIFVVSQGHFTDGNDHRNLLRNPGARWADFCRGECSLGRCEGWFDEYHVFTYITSKKRKSQNTNNRHWLFERKFEIL